MVAVQGNMVEFVSLRSSLFLRWVGQYLDVRLKVRKMMAYEIIL